MKIILSLFILLSALFSMNDFRNVPHENVKLLQEGKNKKYCPICGMTLPFFYKTNHSATHKGKNKHYCSIVCMVRDAIENNKTLTDFKAVDANTLQWIDSKDAYFVVGSSKPATMSHISKYAFKNKKDAQKFAKKYGGEIMRFDELFKRVSFFLNKEIEATKKRQKKAATKGKIIYQKFCKQTDIKFHSVADAKTFVEENTLCGNLKGKKLQMVGLYLYNR